MRLLPGSPHRKLCALRTNHLCKTCNVNTNDTDAGLDFSYLLERTILEINPSLYKRQQHKNYVHVHHFCEIFIQQRMFLLKCTLGLGETAFVVQVVKLRTGLLLNLSEARHFTNLICVLINFNVR